MKVHFLISLLILTALYSTSCTKSIQGQTFQNTDNETTLTAIYYISATKGESITLPAIKLEDEAMGTIDWGDGSEEKFKEGNGSSIIVPIHNYYSDYSGEIKIYVKTGKIIAAQYKDDTSYSIVNNALMKIVPINAIRFINASQPSIICYLSMTGTQKFEYSYNGLEWHNWNYLSAMELVIYIMGGAEPSAKFMELVRTDPEEVGCLPIGKEHDCIYIRGNNPEGLNHANIARVNNENYYPHLVGYYNFMGISISESQFYVMPIASLNGVTETTYLECDGDIMHLLNYETVFDEIPCEFCFCGLFHVDKNYQFFSLTKAPELTATILKPHCYHNIFAENHALNKITCLASDVSPEYSIDYLFNKVSNKGTLIKSKDTDWDGLPLSIFPNGWKAVNIDGTTTTPTPGMFSVGFSGEKVRFAPGNLFWDGNKFEFEKNQYDCMCEWDSNHVSSFFWSQSADIATAKEYYSLDASLYDSFFASEGRAINNWSVLSKNEWNFLLNSLLRRVDDKNSLVKKIAGRNNVILIPDGYFSDILKESYTKDQWLDDEMEYGLVALPIINDECIYWTSTPNRENKDKAHSINFSGYKVIDDRGFGLPVRLVKYQ